MSGHHAERQKSTDKKEKVIGRENVGMLLLGLWTGEELLSESSALCFFYAPG
jgi:hypothetical protein